VLVSFPSAGLYCVLDEAAPVNATLANANAGVLQSKLRYKDRRLLSFVRVGQGRDIADASPDGYGRTKYWHHVRNELLAANTDLPPRVRQDLGALRIAEYAPVKDIVCPPQGCAPTRSDEFTIDLNFSGPAPVVTFGINNISFLGNPNDPAYPTYAARNYFKPVLGKTQEWTITGGFEHIFHVHVNPFQIVDVLDVNNTSIFKKTASGALYKNALGLSECTDAAKQAFTDPATGAVDLQYCDQGGVIRDTVVQLGGPFVPGLPPKGYKVVMRTRYEDFTGRFVMHCHILDHEDEGMMMDVDIVSPTTALIDSVVDPVKRSYARAENTLQRLGILPAPRRGPPLPDDQICTTPIPGAPLRAALGANAWRASSRNAAALGTGF